MFNYFDDVQNNKIVFSCAIWNIRIEKNILKAPNRERASWAESYNAWKSTKKNLLSKILTIVQSSFRFYSLRLCFFLQLLWLGQQAGFPKDKSLLGITTKYIVVILYRYQSITWVHFLRVQRKAQMASRWKFYYWFNDFKIY